MLVPIDLIDSVTRIIARAPRVSTANTNARKFSLAENPASVINRVIVSRKSFGGRGGKGKERKDIFLSGNLLHHRTSLLTLGREDLVGRNVTPIISVVSRITLPVNQRCVWVSAWFNLFPNQIRVAVGVTAELSDSVKANRLCVPSRR